MPGTVGKAVGAGVGGGVGGGVGAAARQTGTGRYDVYSAQKIQTLTYLSISIYIYIYISIYACIYTYIYIYIHVCVHVCVYMCVYRPAEAREATPIRLELAIRLLMT